MNQRGLGVVQALRTVSCQAEIRILIDCTRNQARNLSDALLVAAEDVREGCGESSGALDTGKVNLADI